MSKTNDLVHTLMLDIQAFQLVDFLVADIETFLCSLNWYRLTTLQKNFPDFLAHITMLHQHYCQRLDELQQEEYGTGDMQIVIGTLHNTAQIQLVNEIRGFFLLTAMEYAQASSMRMLMRKQMPYVMKNEEGIMKNEEETDNQNIESLHIEHQMVDGEGIMKV